MINYVVTAIISVGIGALINGVVVFYFQKNVNKILCIKEYEEKRRKDLRKERREIDDELWHSVGRVIFWVNKAITTGEHNGDLEKAVDAFSKAEELKKRLDRDIIAGTEI